LRAAAILLVLAACTTVEKQRADSLGPETEEPGPRHRPGQPCLWCHSTTDGDGRASSFDLAGTIYERRDGDAPAAGAEIELQGADGTITIVNANLVGNFALLVEPGLDRAVQTDEGIWRVPGPLTFPLRTTVRDGGRTRRMRNVIHRERSCAVCHTDPPGAASAGRIHVIEDADAGVPDAASLEVSP
jgi:hypothetical protein